MPYSFTTMRFTLGFGVLLLVGASALYGCAPKAAVTEEDAETTTTENCFDSGDILVSNTLSDAVLALDSSGNFKNVVFNVQNYSETVAGTVYNSSTNEIYIAVDGSDRIIAISKSNCDTQRTVVADANFTGTLKALTLLTTGEILAVETSNVEKFTSAGIRITAGAWPKALQTNGSGLKAMSNGGFVHCSFGTNVVRTYDSAGTQVATLSSGIATTATASDCMVLASGDIAVAWYGTTDTVRIYNSALSSTVASYVDATLMPNPNGLAQRSNGNILISDLTNHHIVEITSAGVYVGTLGDALLNGPSFLTVIP